MQLDEIKYNCSPYFISIGVRLGTLFKYFKTNKGDFCLIGQFFLRLSLINFTSGSGRLEKADEDFKKQQGQLA